MIGIAAACRCDEMIKMGTSNVQDLGSLLLINIPDSKTHKKRSFTVIGEPYISICRKYVSLRLENIPERRFFLKYCKGKCHRAVMGIHSTQECCILSEITALQSTQDTVFGALQLHCLWIVEPILHA